MVTLAPNDPRQYDDLAGEWWRPGGAFEVLHWLAAARARLVPAATRRGALLVDVGCGGGLLAPHLVGKGYRHVGVDLRRAGLEQAAARAALPVQGDAVRLPLRTACADVVVAGEILEHVTDLPGAVAELCRVLRPGGLLVLDTVNATALSRFVIVTVGERLPGVPRGIHDAALFVDPARLTAECARHGVRLRVRGLRPSASGMVRWLTGRTGGRIVPSRSTAVLYQGAGRKEEAADGR
ncbi:methyltransferase domain-containing protein [Spirilliplanes yamanashiensis]|uniref:Ubiquinone biosynthesis O-methyltransferase n=1 Tax=Spirilliplanes yamanashiensis TaxID=42233 RepID=A0A8J4DHK1_9ACTN|nr:methyltransferase domain-containing protein [Spirilliplanes yamanashiensis]MDP9814550.1 2-polyprenyl-6-hydroxyphenyl methylase/3-demethylubiquinone-9 3-methyltransferase [Spirilliplanes yamanashiensis]GIJ02202.1 ubiquinone biosynthesis O-methyltransferase [Spirilliplanes yamanashiensis]